MPGFQTFACDDVPIADINAWARSRGEKMVRYKRCRNVPDVFSGRVVREEEEGVMPSSFFESLLMTDGWHYVELERLEPKSE